MTDPEHHNYSEKWIRIFYSFRITGGAYERAFSKNDEKVAETFRSSRCHCGTAAYCAVFGSDDPGNPYARESVPENPIDGMEKSSMVMLTGTKEVLAEQTKENGSSRQQMRISSQKIRICRRRRANRQKKAELTARASESTGSGSKNENGSSTEANRDASGNNSWQ